jgi:dihydrolipoamide dehydrogenase
MSAEAESTFDVVVLGGGSGGYACALRSAELGLSVALVEKGKLGGTCLHMGCIPTKALLHAAEVADSARDGEQFGVKTTFESVDMSGVNRYKDGVIGRLYKGLQGLVRSRQIDYVEGEGRLVAANTVEDAVPPRVVVLGGGVIGVEFASVFTSFGSEVTIVEALPRLVAAEDEAVSKQLERSFRKRKINVRTGARFAGAKQQGDVVTVSLESGDTVEADLLLVAVGRGPVTSGLGYEEAGVAMDRGYVLADDRCHTNVEGVFAVGDIVPGLQLAHRGFAQGIFVAEEIAGLNPPAIDELGIPRVTYCDPEIASVGLTEAQAREKYGQVETYDYNLGGNGRSQILQTQGFVKLVREKDGPVVGVHMIGARMGEQVGEAQLIYNWEALPSDVAQLIHAHPTQNEALGEAHLALAGKPLHAHA